ncbi:PepSY-associated TM helix domain-containing protein [Salinithrix halophila]|uniref:PepSY-associated TM helix domain-containing protein n=1 Tax=Salinithrix halophila TaxID=1485204 RepID=A0ABV8JGG0_9BACL
MPSGEDRRSLPLFAAIWRWHFYAGIFFTPFLVMLAVTGGIYLFKPQIESVLYKDLFFVSEGKKLETPSQQIDRVKSSFPDAEIIRYKLPLEANRTSEVGLVTAEGESRTLFVNPYNGKVVGQLKDDQRLMDQIEQLHGELMAGTIGDRLVELAACWAMILLITGAYLWWPRHRKGIFGTFLPRLKQGKRAFWRDLHAVPAFWLSLFIAFLILTGLPWSGFWGEQLQKIGTATQTGYPASLWGGDKPESTIPAKDVADVPWAAEQQPVPRSKATLASPLSIDQVVNIADSRGIHPGYNVTFPEGAKGVYTVSVFPDKSVDEATMHIDQYSGKVLGDYRFRDYGPLAKIIATGITLHKGTHYGLPNQIAGLLVCLGIVGIAITGIVMWWKRKPSGNRLGAPPLPKNFRMVKGVGILVAVLGILFPLAGCSLLLVLLLDRLVIRKIPRMKQWLG